MSFEVNPDVKNRSLGAISPPLSITETLLDCCSVVRSVVETARYKSLLFAWAIFALSPAVSIFAEDAVHAGLAYDHFTLTLDDGERSEAVGPFFYEEQQDIRHTWAIPPFFSHLTDPGTDSEEYDVLYPLLTYDRFGQQYRWQIGQLFNFAGGPTQTETARDRFSLFPIYLQQRSSNPSENYTSVFPIYGHLKNRLFRDEIFFVLFPIFGESRKKDVVTDNYVYPFFHLRHGDKLNGWQLWPIVGHEHKEVTWETNGFGDAKLIGGHDSRFVLWPLFMNQHAGIGTKNPQWQQASIPAYNFLRSPERDQTTVIWPFFTWVIDRQKGYREKELPWPFFVMARGPGKNTTRIFPFFSQATAKSFATNQPSSGLSTNPVVTTEATLQSRFYAWPIYKYNRAQAEPLDRERTRILFFLYSDTIERNTETSHFARRINFFPFYEWRHELNGDTRLQVFGPIEPYLPNNKSIIRNWAPLWTVWRSEKNPTTGRSSRSLLWNLYRHDVSPNGARTSACFGLYQSESGERTSRHICYIPIGKSGKVANNKTLKDARSR
jgi:hypothetical protein